MEKLKIFVDIFWCESYLKEIIRHHRGIKFPNQFFTSIIWMLHKTLPLPGFDHFRNPDPIQRINIHTAL
ncbi:hypothetical protein ACOSQ3_014348 [Xanthoceras sorbifolium]